ncbi:MAG: hypothetical protein AB1714_17765 [Acidobacteriota bacterium]
MHKIKAKGYAIERWSDAERRLLWSLRSPVEVQAFLDDIPYSTDSRYRCPRSVVQDRVAHCFDGAVFAAAALSTTGHRPLLMDLFAVRDDDHVVALFRKNGHWGAVAKSNCSGLRFREPIFRSLRELALSYFEFYFNLDSEKTLRSYSVPVDLRSLDSEHWISRDETMKLIAERLNAARHWPLLTRSMARALSITDPRTYAAGFYGADERGLYKPEPTSRLRGGAAGVP